MIREKEIKAVKVCSKCGEEKPLSEFYKRKVSKDGFEKVCQNCHKEHIAKNYEKLILENKQYQKENPIEKKTCTKCRQVKSVSEFGKKAVGADGLRSQCKDCDNSYSRQQHFKNHNKNLQRIKQYRFDNPEYFINYKFYKYHTDVSYKIENLLRGRVRLAIKNNQKAGHTIELLMCSIPELKTHLEKQFRTGMTWDNWGNGHGKWNIDHIIPCSFFNMLDPIEQYMCFRWQNLQPLWWEDNMNKNDKIIILT